MKCNCLTFKSKDKLKLHGVECWAWYSSLSSDDVQRHEHIKPQTCTPDTWQLNVNLIMFKERLRCGYENGMPFGISNQILNSIYITQRFTSCHVLRILFWYGWHKSQNVCKMILTLFSTMSKPTTVWYDSPLTLS